MATLWNYRIQTLLLFCFFMQAHIYGQTINGPDKVCPGSQFTLFVINGQSGIWEVNENVFFVITESGTSITLQGENTPSAFGTHIIRFFPNNGAPELQKLVTIKHLPNINTPQWEMPPPSAIGFCEQTFELKVSSIKFENTNIEADYKWTLPQGWSISAGNGTRTVKVQTDNCSTGTISVRVVDDCGNEGFDLISFPIERSKPSLSFGTSANLNSAGDVLLLCGQTDQISFEAGSNIGNCISDNDFHWTFPSGWSPQSATGLTAVSTPPATGAEGEITVSILGCNGTINEFTRKVAITITDSDNPLKITRQQSSGTPICNGQSETFTLGGFIPAGAAVTWHVTPEYTVVQSDGNGLTAVLTPANSYAASEVKLTFSIFACDLKASKSITVHIGPPSFENVKIDGVSATSASLCPGSHYCNLEIKADADNCPTWTISPELLHFATCTEFDFVLPPYGSGAFIAAYGENVCGTSNQYFIISTKRWGCDEKREGTLVMYPNPANEILNLEFKSDTETGTTPEDEVRHIRVYDKMGNLRLEQTDFTPNLHIGRLPEGTYYLELDMGDSVVRELFVIQR